MTSQDQGYFSPIKVFFFSSTRWHDFVRGLRRWSRGALLHLLGTAAAATTTPLPTKEDLAGGAGREGGHGSLSHPPLLLRRPLGGAGVPGCA